MKSLISPGRYITTISHQTLNLKDQTLIHTKSSILCTRIALTTSLRFVPFGPESTVLRFRFVAVCSWLPGPLNNDTQTRQLVTGDEIWLSLPNPIKYLSSSMPPLRIFSHWLKNIFCEALDIRGIGTIFAELRTQLQCWHLFMAIYK